LNWRVALPFEHHVERLQQRQPGLQQRRQLLPEDDQQRVRDPAPAQPQLAERQAALDVEEVEPALLEFRPQGGLVGGREAALHDLAGGRAHFADVFHARGGFLVF
jgi:hypothetical protein